MKKNKVLGWSALLLIFLASFVVGFKVAADFSLKNVEEHGFAIGLCKC